MATKEDLRAAFERSIKNEFPHAIVRVDNYDNGIVTYRFRTQQETAIAKPDGAGAPLEPEVARMAKSHRSMMLKEAGAFVGSFIKGNRIWVQMPNGEMVTRRLDSDIEPWHVCQIDPQTLAEYRVNSASEI